MNKIATSTKNFWNAHKGQIAVAGIVTTVTVLAIALRAGKQFNEFLDEKGLSNEYYRMDEI